MIKKIQGKIGITCCSNLNSPKLKESNEKLIRILGEMGIEAKLSKYIYQEDASCYPSPQEKVAELMRFYQDDEITTICDISGGDMANQLLRYIDFDIIKNSNKQFWGYSDLSTIINAIYHKTGKSSVLYHLPNLVYDKIGHRIKEFFDFVQEEKQQLFMPDYRFVRGDKMSGVVVGGNMRCLLKLAGTGCFPDVKGKILVLEVLDGDVPRMITFLSQYQQLGVFDDIAGLILGRFTKMENLQKKPTIEDLVTEYLPKEIPIIKTSQIGHDADSRAIIIGEYLEIDNNIA